MKKNERTGNPGKEFCQFFTYIRYHMAGCVGAMIYQASDPRQGALLGKIADCEDAVRGNRPGNYVVEWQDLQAILVGTLRILLAAIEEAL